MYPGQTAPGGLVPMGAENPGAVRPGSLAVDNAVSNSIKAGVTYAVAAGNGNKAGIGQDACKSSPARVQAALTIGATDRHQAWLVELRQVRRLVRPRGRDPLRRDVVQLEDGDGDLVGHVHGHSAHCRRGRAVPLEVPHRPPGEGPEQPGGHSQAW